MMDKSIYYSPEQLHDYEEKLERESQELDTLLTDILFIMSDPRGRRVINWILRVTEPYFDHFNRDAHVMAHKLGKAYVGSQLHQAVMIKCPQLYIQMVNEYNSALKSKKMR